jgi:phosphatidate cytidylyltransferase
MAHARAEMADLRWADLGVRAASAAVLAPLAVLAIWLGGAPWVIVAVVFAIGLGCEWPALWGERVRVFPGILVPVAVGIVGLCGAIGAWGSGLAMLAASFLLTAMATGRIGADRGARRAPVTFAAGIVMIGAALLSLLYLRDDRTIGFANVMFLMVVVWATDVGAYMFGRLLGGPRLVPLVSPAKTWAGAAGGVLAAIAAGLLAARLFGAGYDLRAAWAALGLGLFAQCGDLGESWLKRRRGLKDSSRIIPGHGGLLDRLDGVLASAPAAALLSLVHGAGMPLWQ